MSAVRKPGCRGAPPTIYGIDLGIALHERRILVADHSAFNRRILARFLGWAGITQIAFAGDGQTALSLAESWNPDLAILDLALPDQDGIEVCRTLRQSPAYRDLPIIIQSAFTSDAIRAQSFHAGATDIIGKPINPGECIARVRYHLERRSLVQEFRDFRERVERDLMMARDMQLGLVPEPEPVARLSERYGLAVSSHFQSSDEIGGDFWTLFEVDERRLGVFIADLSGHGIPAAINAFRLHTLLTRVPHAVLLNPSALLESLNNRLHEILSTGQYATALYGIIDVIDHRFTYAAASSPSPILWRDGRLEMCDSSGVFLGPFENEVYENRSVAFPPGSFLFLYSDALIESRDAGGRPLGEAGLVDLIGLAVEGGSEQPLPVLLDGFAALYGAHLNDDLTMVWIDRR